MKALEGTESSRVGSNHQGNVECYSCGAMYEVGRLNVEPFGFDQEQGLIEDYTIPCTSRLLEAAQKEGPDMDFEVQH
ncbi:unnamed protein product [Nippostrongylus brasiliensis]|uniref:DPH-type MB domain-containing protein n=1 Tax=Nippostrongylus brasiliensis TaxID=27835 RepID=A0A158R329_NIPBR|nr:unnamed protein product [Nippostrongylus brasiliensis]